MKNITIIILIICIISLISVGIVLISQYKAPIENGNLNVNGKTIYGKKVIIYEKYAELPLIEVMQNLGFQVDWIDNYTANVMWGDKTYVLDLSETTFIENGESFNYLKIPPGSKHYSCKAMEKDLLLDSATFRVVMRMIGCKVSVEVDYCGAVVYIEPITEDNL